MPWQFYADMGPGRTYWAGIGNIEGPTPCKRWRYAPGERAKKNKLHYRWHYDPRGSIDADAYNEKLARRYVEWLAERDGIKIPNCPKSRVVWSGFYSASKKRKHKRWSGEIVEQEAYCKRIQAIEWGRDEERYNTRKDGRRGAWSHNEFMPDLRIEIPHWDFEPIVTEETIEA